MKVRPSVLVIENQHVLLMQYFYGGTDVYNLPGGNPDPGETLEQTLIRELQEEMGIEIEIGKMLLTGEVILPQQKNDVLHVVFAGEIIGGIPILNPSETSAKALVWKPITEIQHLEMYPNVGSELQRILFEGNGGQYIGRIRQKWHE